MFWQKEIPDRDGADFIVVGGGLSGVSAALAAARRGIKTVLVERTACLGGNATGGGVHHLLGGRRFVREENCLVRGIGGIFSELTGKLIDAGAAIDPRTVDFRCNPHGWAPFLGEGVVFDPEALKLLLDTLCRKAGVEVLFDTVLLDAVRRGNTVERVILQNKSGIFSLSAARFADATGDADLAFAAGFETVLGREEDHLSAPATLEMTVGGVDTARLTDYIREHSPDYTRYRFREEIKAWRAEGIWDFPFDVLISVQLAQPDVYMVNTLRQVGVDGTDGDAVSRAISDGRRDSARLFAILREKVPGFESATLRSTATVLGVRETRRIVGRYVLSVADLMDNTRFPDTVALTCYGWDLPDPKKPSLQPMEGKAVPMVTPIPYRTLLPREAENLISVGRQISVERDVLGPVRVMAPCIAMGEAAGVATARSLSEQVGYPDIALAPYLAELRAAGAILSEDEVVREPLTTR